MAGWTSKTTNATRVITRNEENRVKNIADSGNGTSFLYDDQGERVVKGGGGNESVYLNRFYSLKNGDLGSKHIFAGETRVCTKIEKDGGSIQSGVPGSGAFLVSQGIYNALRHGNVDNKRGILRRLPGTTTGGTTTGTNPPLEKFEFFYHGDHLGSSSFITDDAGSVYQELEYFPYGETWVEEGGSGQMPMYRFTGKELDPETGLYYYGARYYDPVLSRWISSDPALIDYLSIEKLKILTMGDSGIYGDKYNYNHGYFSPQVDKYIKNYHLYEQALYGSDKPGLYRPSNLHLYTYTFNNPVKNIDPNGLQTFSGELTFDLGPVKTGAGLELSPNDFTITQPTSAGAPATTFGMSGSLGFNPASHEIGPKMGNVSTSVKAGIYAKDFSAGVVIESGKPLGYELGFGISTGPLKAGTYANVTKTKTGFSLGQFMAQAEMEICNALGIPYGVARY